MCENREWRTINRVQQWAQINSLEVRREYVSGVLHLEVINPRRPQAPELIVSSWFNGKRIVSRALYGGRPIPVRDIEGKRLPFRRDALRKK